MLCTLLMCLLAPHAIRPTTQDASWQKLQGFYQESPLDLSKVNETVTTEANDVKIKFTFPGSGGDTADGYLVEPIGSRHAPCVIVAHGFSADKSFGYTFGDTLLKNGIAWAAIDAPHHGERCTPADKKEIAQILAGFKKRPPGRYPLKTLPALMLDAMHGDVLDSRHLIDYLQSRKEIDSSRIGVIAQSMGSMECEILGAVEPRIKCMALEVGGAFGPVTYAATPPAALPTAMGLYAVHMKIPVLLLCASHDSQMPRVATDRLLNAIPKKTTTLKWYDADHWLNPTAHQDAARWVVDRLSGHG
jgi:dienelactone hydrolase